MLHCDVIMFSGRD